MNTNRRLVQSEIAERSPAERSYSNVVRVSVTETSLVAMRVVPCRSSNVSVPAAVLAEGLAETDALGLRLAEALALGLRLAEGLTLADALAEGDREALGEADAEADAEGLTLAEAEADGLTLALADGLGADGFRANATDAPVPEVTSQLKAPVTPAVLLVA
jgi:hypothetical protein